MRFINCAEIYALGGVKGVGVGWIVGLGAHISTYTTQLSGSIFGTLGIRLPSGNQLYTDMTVGKGGAVT